MASPSRAVTGGNGNDPGVVQKPLSPGLFSPIVCRFNVFRSNDRSRPLLPWRSDMLRRSRDAMLRGTAVAGLAASVVLICAALLAGPNFLSSRASADPSGLNPTSAPSVMASAALPSYPSGR